MLHINITRSTEGCARGGSFYVNSRQVRSGGVADRLAYRYLVIGRRWRSVLARLTIPGESSAIFRPPSACQAPACSGFRGSSVRFCKTSFQKSAYPRNTSNTTENVSATRQLSLIFNESVRQDNREYNCIEIRPHQSCYNPRRSEQAATHSTLSRRQKIGI